MPRPSPTSRADIAQILDDARRRNNLSFRDAAKLVDVPAATAQGWFNGKHLPGPALRPKFASLVEQLGVADQIPLDWVQLNDALTSLRGTDAPYVGLRPFETTDAPVFFGRDAQLDRLVAAVQERAARHGIVAVLGPSGCGKSSLLAAGLAGRACAEGGALAGRTTGVLTASDLITGEAPDVDLIVVDQAEDALTAAHPDQIVAKIAAAAARSTVVLGIRADAYGALAEFPQLRDALEHPVLLTAMTMPELREAIEGPAAARGVTVEPGLVEVMVADLGPEASSGLPPVTALPLLQNALLLTWGVGRGRRMTIEDYRATGGLSSAIESLSEDVFGGLDEQQQDAARQLFLRLVRTPRDDAVVRTSIPLAELTACDAAVVDDFVDARILVKTDAAVRISHESLLTHWPRLAWWIGENREDLRARENLNRAAQLWVDNDRADGSLLPIDRLPLFVAFVDDPAKEALLTPVEEEFLTASRAHFTRLLDQERRTTRQLRRRGRGLASLMALSLCLALIAGVALLRTQQVQREGQSRQIALQASQLRARDPNLQAQMAQAAAGIADTREGRSALLDATAIDVPTRWPSTGSSVLAATIDGSLVAQGNGAGEVTLWKDDELGRSPGTKFKADPAGRQIFWVALRKTATRSLLAVGGSAGHRSLWDVTSTPRKLADLGGDALTAYAVAFSRDGTRLAVGYSDGKTSTVELWGTDDPEHPDKLASVALGVQVSGLAFDPVRSRLYASGFDAKVAQWDVAASGLAPLPDLTFSHPASPRTLTLAVSPDGQWLAAGLASAGIARWDLGQPTAPASLTTAPFTTWTNAVAFSADSSRLLVGDSDQRVHVLNAASMVETRLLQCSAIVTGVADAAGVPVASSTDGTLWRWSAQAASLRSGGGVIYQLATDDAGSRWVAGTAFNDGEVELWSIRDGLRALPAAKPPPELVLSAATAISSDGARLFSGTRSGEVITWDLTDAGAGSPRLQRIAGATDNLATIVVNKAGTLLAATEYTGLATVLARVAPDGTITPVATLPTPTPQVASSSPDDRLLQLGLGEGGVQLWDVSDPGSPVLRATAPTEGNPGASAFSASGRFLAAGTEEGVVLVWDVTDPGHPREVQRFTDPRSAIYTVVFSPDDKTLLAGGGDEVFWTWDLEHPDRVATLALDGRMGRTTDARFVRGGTMFIGAGRTGAVRAWTLDASAAGHQLCANRGAALTADEWARYLPGIAPYDPCATH